MGLLLLQFQQISQLGPLGYPRMNPRDQFHRLVKGYQRRQAPLLSQELQPRMVLLQLQQERLQLLR